MSGSEALMNESVDDLRRAFDRSFALTPNAEADATIVENLLAVRIGPHPYALRLADVSGLFVDKKVTWLPSPVSELLGITGLRAAVLPVYDLGMLLGYPKATAARWLLVTAAAPIGLAFESFDGYLSVRRGAIVPDARADTVERHVREILQTEVARPIIHLPSILETIRNRGGHNRQT
jgi:chemotaxis signal transduction protein